MTAAMSTDANPPTPSAGLSLLPQLWDLRSNALLQHYSGGTSGITGAAWHPSGNFLLTSSLDTTLKASIEPATRVHKCLQRVWK
jgi:WD40 repeat protein